MSPKLVKTFFISVSLLYLVAGLFFPFYWKKIFHVRVIYKGDTELLFAQYLLYITLVFSVILLSLSKPGLKSFVLLLFPLLTIISSLVLGFIILLITSTPGIPEKINLIYATIYVISNVATPAFVYKAIFEK